MLNRSINQSVAYCHCGNVSQHIEIFPAVASFHCFYLHVPSSSVEVLNLKPGNELQFQIRCEFQCMQFPT